MARGLVLGGGGAVGVAWESGLLWGLSEAGVMPEAFDVLVGTSAGAIVGAQLAQGTLPTRPDSPEASRATAPAGPSQLDLVTIGKVFNHWTKLERTTPADAAVIGMLARTLYRDQEPEWLARVDELIGKGARGAWPERTLLVTAVDTESGERVVFDKHSGVPLAHAVAASAAVPGITVSVEIEGRRYMDGQVHSSTNADLLLDLEAPSRCEEVVIAMPTNAATGQGIGPHAERAAAAEIERLRAIGCRVLHVTPSAADAERFGRNLMSPKGAPAAFEAGFTRGKQLALELG